MSSTCNYLQQTQLLRKITVICKCITMHSIRNWFYKRACRIIVKRLRASSNKLTPEHLTGLGWVGKGQGYEYKTDNTRYVEPLVKDRDKIIIEFEHHYYRVWHGSRFIALETSVEWFEVFMMCLDKRNPKLI